MTEALSREHSFEKIWLQRGLTGELEIAVRAYCKEYDIPLQIVPKAKLDRMTRSAHQGIIGQSAISTSMRWEEWLVDLDSDKCSMVLIADQITDVRNLGALCRSAEVFGVRHLLLPKQQSALINQDAVKSSAGAILRIKITKVASLAVAIETLQMRDFLILSAELGQALVCDLDIRPNQRIALILGSEDRGVRPHLSRIADHKISIPQVGKTDSLNVSVAGGILLYALRNKLSAISV